MKQKDYKEIAKIIKNDFIQLSGELHNSFYQRKKLFSNNLADYFEKIQCGNIGKHDFSEVSTIGNKYCSRCYLVKGFEFNKKQFLKDCGLK